MNQLDEALKLIKDFKDNPDEKDFDTLIENIIIKKNIQIEQKESI